MNAAVEISNVKNRQESIVSKIAFAESEKDIVMIRSVLAGDVLLNEHLVWLWGRLKHERRYLKNLKQDGAILTVRIKGVSGNIVIQANGAEMLHLLNAQLVIER